MKQSALVVCAVAVVAALVVSSRPSGAHVGVAVAVAKFMTPPDPGIVHADPNDTTTPAPYAWTTADASYTIKWDDGDADPTGRFTFYYMDHEPTFQVSADDIETPGVATKIDEPNNLSGGFFASCYCEGDQGVTCPVVTRDPGGNCANQVTWNTSGIAPGTYWIIAVNNDPPYHVYYVSYAPIRVVHGGTPLPAALILRPDGYGAWDTMYHLQWLADGKPPLTFDLAYGVEDTGTALTPQTQLASGLTIAPAADGSYSYDWDISQLANNKSYWVRLTITDGDGKKTYTDSHFGMTVFHSGTTAAPDMAVMPPKKSGCEIGAGAVDDARSRGMLSMLGVLAALAAAFYVARRAARRG